jgi:hypothetical protein
VEVLQLEQCQLCAVLNLLLSGVSGLVRDSF